MTNEEIRVFNELVDKVNLLSSTILQMDERINAIVKIDIIQNRLLDRLNIVDIPDDISLEMDTFIINNRNKQSSKKRF